MTHRTPARISIPLDGRQHRILLVDDHWDTAISLEGWLENMGQEVVMAHTGGEAMEVAESFLPQLVFLDIGLPGLDGYEVCRRMRTRTWGARIPIIALTESGMPDDGAKAQSAGFTRHLAKPLNPAILGDLLAGLLVETSPLPLNEAVYPPVQVSRLGQGSL